MPKDYSKSKIYKLEPICESEEGDVYIGSTTQNYISHRLAEHVRKYKQWKNGTQALTYSFLLFEKYGIDNIRIILLESYPCSNNDELRVREAYYQKSMKCVNKCIAFRTKEEISEKKKQYRQEYLKELSEYNKQYREEHQKEISEKQKIYYQNRKQELSEIITCECGREIRKDYFNRHQDKDIHKELMLQIHDVEKKNDAI